MLFSFIATTSADIDIDSSCKTCLDGSDATARIQTAFQGARNFVMAAYL